MNSNPLYKSLKRKIKEKKKERLYLNCIFFRIKKKGRKERKLQGDYILIINVKRQFYT
jgi:hypothetical protein